MSFNDEENIGFYLILFSAGTLFLMYYDFVLFIKFFMLISLISIADAFLKRNF